MNDVIPRSSLLQRLREEVRAQLQLSAEIIESQGSLEAGEEFTVLFRVQNRFAGVEHLHDAEAWFRDVVLQLEPTEFAEPLPEPNQEFLLANDLGAGQSATCTVRFRAKIRLGNVVFLELPGPFVRARVDADFDFQQFFHVVQEQGFVPDVKRGPIGRRRPAPSLFPPRRQPS